MTCAIPWLSLVMTSSRCIFTELLRAEANSAPGARLFINVLNFCGLISMDYSWNCPTRMTHEQTIPSPTSYQASSLSLHPRDCYPYSNHWRMMVTQNPEFPFWELPDVSLAARYTCGCKLYIWISPYVNSMVLIIMHVHILSICMHTQVVHMRNIVYLWPTSSWTLHQENEATTIAKHSWIEGTSTGILGVCPVHTHHDARLPQNNRHMYTC